MSEPKRTPIVRPARDEDVKPLRVAIVGAGPSGLFAAQALAAQGGEHVRVDIYDRLPTPFGLLRYGVAPDHTSIKAVADALAKVFESSTITFCGMVEFGKDVTRAELLQAYDAVIYAAGASADRHLGVPGELLPGSRSAREFVAWYSGHPDARPQHLTGVRSAVLVGVGNVAVDVARILLKSPEDLEETDMPEEVLAELHRSRVRDVWIVGRRGPQHASFTSLELRELLATPGVAVTVSEGAFDDIDEEDLDRRTRANVSAIAEAAARRVENPRARLHLLFWHRPVSIEGEHRVTGITLERTLPAGAGEVTGTGERITIETDLVLRAIGYRGRPLADVPFDVRRGIIPNASGRVTDEQGRVQPREYVVGWIKRGPIGVVGTNKTDAVETVRNLLADLPAAPRSAPRPDLHELMRQRGFTPTTFADWRRIDDAEQRRGSTHGRRRTKIEAWHELIDLISHERPGGPPTPGE